MRYKQFYLILVLLLPAILQAEAVITTGLNDPMRPASYTTGLLGSIEPDPKEEAVLVLTVTMVKDDERYAVINNARYQEGDVVAGSRVVKITSGAVLLDREGEEVKLSVLPTGLKRYKDGKK